MQKVTPAFKNSGSSPNLNLRCFPLPGLVFTLELFPIHTKYLFLAFVFVFFIVFVFYVCLIRGLQQECPSPDSPVHTQGQTSFGSLNWKMQYFVMPLQIMTVLNFDIIHTCRCWCRRWSWS